MILGVRGFQCITYNVSKIASCIKSSRFSLFVLKQWNPLSMSSSCRKIPRKRLRSDSSSVGALYTERSLSSTTVAKKTRSAMIPNPVKSPNDKRDYRPLILDNGLRVLLISDTHGLTAADLEQESDEETNAENESKHPCVKEHDTLEDEGEETASESDESDDDDHEGQQKSHVKKSAASLCIGVGSFCDPPDIPGFAHFLEHMVFMGSQKYPKENELDQFLNNHDGYSNAWTDCERTCFYFDVERKHFPKALDIFANFFVSPLFLEDTVDREIEAVDSEFQMSIPRDGERVNHLFGTFAKEGHPMGKFFSGNKDTLKHKPEKMNINIYSKLRDFYTRMYSAQYMTLAVQSQDTLDQMESIVRDIFSNIPNNNQPVPSFDHLTDPFEPGKFRKMYSVVPVADKNSMLIVWPFPPSFHQYKEKPLEYASFLLGHEGPGSLFSYLKKKLWAISIEAGTSFDGFDMNSTYTCFSISIKLTDKGFEERIKVLQALFEYILLIQKDKPKQLYFDEMKQVQENRFRWREQIDPVDYVEAVSENMHMFPWEHIMTGRSQMYNYDEELIQWCNNNFRVDNCNIIISSKKFDDGNTCNETEPLYNTKYGVEDIPQELFEVYSKKQYNPAFYLPEANQFIATDFELKELVNKEDNLYPKVLFEDKLVKFWFKQDDKFLVPKGSIYTILYSPVAHNSVENVILNDIFVTLLMLNLNDKAYAASICGLTYSMFNFDTGIEIKASGFNHKLDKLFKVLLEEFLSFTSSVTKEEFEMIRKEIRRSYDNSMRKTFPLGRKLRLRTLMEHFTPPPLKLAHIDKITFEMLIKFVEDFQQNIKAEAFLMGNFNPDDARMFNDMIRSKLKGQVVPEEKMLKERTFQIPQGKFYCKVKGHDPEDTNSCVTVYLQSEAGTMRTACLNELLDIKMSEPCFDILRTKHQLGYSVFTQAVITNGILGLTVTVEYQANKFSVHDVNGKINEFLVEFQKILEETTEEKFQELVDSTIAAKLEEDNHMGEEIGRHWVEIHSRHYRFNKKEREVEILKTFTLNDLKQWYAQYLDGRCRQVSYQVEGKTEACSNGEAISLTCENGHFRCLVDEKQSAEPIRDIEELRKKLTLLPYHQIL